MGKSKNTENRELFVALNGNDQWSGLFSEPNETGSDGPFATLQKARDAVRSMNRDRIGSITVQVRSGTHFLGESLIFEPGDSGTADCPIIYAAFPGERPVLSGGRKIEGEWQPYRDGIKQCSVPWAKDGKGFSQLFVGGERQVLARYPNRDEDNPSVTGEGYINIVGRTNEEREKRRIEQKNLLRTPRNVPLGFQFNTNTFTAKRWKNPQEAVVHIFHASYWGNLQWKVDEIDWERNILWFGEGGFQIWLGVRIADNSRFFVENIFEELDVPHEWYLDRSEGTLYFMPPPGMEMDGAEIIAPVVKDLVVFRGSQNNPVHHISLQGLTFAHTASVFMERYEAVSRGDWNIHRGGTVFLEGTEFCSVEECLFDAVGGNAIFLNNYNRWNRIQSNRFSHAGESAICLVGSEHLTHGSIAAFPADNSVSNNLIHDCGNFGKQVAGVFCAIAQRTRISHNHIYNMPRAGICFNDGWGGGHILEYNHVHDTIRETGDHGPFNSWGREWYWCPVQGHGSASHAAGGVLGYAMETTILRYNYFHETKKPGFSEWGPFGIDLDDGSSNYHVHGNLCIGVGIKCREGDYRTVENNICINAAVVPNLHVLYEYNNDRFLRNIIVLSSEFDRPDLGVYYDQEFTGVDVITIGPGRQGPWLKECDYNLGFCDSGSYTVGLKPRGAEKPVLPKETREYSSLSLEEFRKNGFGKHSVFADPLFVDPAKGDYHLKADSPAKKLGFEDLPLDEFGLTPDFPEWLR